MPNQVEATTRTWPLTSITSAPASRISCTASSSTLAVTFRSGSAIRIGIPGPFAGTVPARIDSSVEPLLGLLPGHPLGVGAGLQLGPGLLQLGDLALQPPRLRAQTVQELDQVLAAGVGVRVVGVFSRICMAPPTPTTNKIDGGDHLTTTRLQTRREPRHPAAGRCCASGSAAFGHARLRRLVGACGSPGRPPRLLRRRIRRRDRGGRLHGQAWNRARRIAAALVKIRMPSTTTTRGGQLGADADLVAHVDDRGGDQHVGDERDDEDPVGEDALQVGPEGAEQRVHRGDDGDRQIGLQHLRERRLQQQAEDDPGQQTDQREHRLGAWTSGGRRPGHKPSGGWHQRDWLYAGFAQDDWRITDTLTLNLGLRYEARTPWTEINNCQVGVNILTGALEFPGNTPVPAGVVGTNGFSDGLYKTTYGLPNFQPRIGFAWNPQALGGKTVIRGAYTISSYLEGLPRRSSLCR